MVKVFLIRKSIQFDMPKAYNEIYRFKLLIKFIFTIKMYIYNKNLINVFYREVLTADANVVDLFKLSKHFYLLGKFLSQLEHREAYEVRRVLIQVIITKFIENVNLSNNFIIINIIFFII